MGKTDRERRKARSEDLRKVRRLEHFAREIEREDPILALALRLEREYVQRGVTRKSTKDLIQRFRSAESIEERAAVAIVMTAHGLPGGRDHLTGVMASTGDSPAKSACSSFLKGLTIEEAKRRANLEAPGGFIHKPVGREKGWDYP